MSVFDSRVLVPDRERPILLVDDDADVRAIVRLVLMRDGLRTIEAGSGDEAITLATHVPPCGVVLDLQLPPCSGEEIAARLRALYPWSLPIVVLSGHPDAPEIAERIGAVACLGKPFNVSELLDAVHRAILARPRLPGGALRGSAPRPTRVRPVLVGAAGKGGSVAPC